MIRTSNDTTPISGPTSSPSSTGRGKWTFNPTSSTTTAPTWRPIRRGRPGFARRSRGLLVIWGRYDLSFDPSEPEAYKRDVPGAEVHVLEAGHFALDTAADEIADLVRGFVKKRDELSLRPGLRLWRGIATAGTSAPSLAVVGVLAAYSSSEAEPRIPFWPLLFNNVVIRLLGSDFAAADKRRAAAESSRPASREERLLIEVAHRFSLDEIAAAHEAVGRPTRPGRAAVLVDRAPRPRQTPAERQQEYDRSTPHRVLVRLLLGLCLSRSAGDRRAGCSSEPTHPLATLHARHRVQGDGHTRPLFDTAQG